MKRFRTVFPVFLIVALALPLGARAQPGTATGAVVDEIVAIVGSRIVLRSEVDALVNGATQSGRQAYSDALWNDALRELVDQHVLTTIAERDTTITVSDDQVNQALDGRIRGLSQQLGGDDKIEAAYGKSLIQIREDLRAPLRDQILAQQAQQRRLRSLRITPSEVAAWFARIPADSLPTLPPTVRVAHIARYPIASPAAKAEAFAVVSAIRDSVTTGGSTFESLASRFSEDPGSASNGGRIEGLRLGELVPEFAAVAARLPLGEISPPFETIFGYHVLRVNDRRGDVVDFSHVLIRVDASSADPAAATTYLNALRDSLQTFGVPFESLAKRHSQDAASAQQSGRVTDTRSRARDLVLDALGPLWKATLDTLEVGEVSRPAPVDLLDGRRAYHIVLLQGREPEHRISLGTDYGRIEEIALQEKQGRELRTWLDRLRDDVYIEYRGKARVLMANG